MVNLRKIQSFVRRSGRLTLSQKRGLTELWADYSIEPKGGIDFEVIFGNDNPIVLEIGFGNGDTLVQMAQENPQWNYVGVEVYEAGIGRLISSTHGKQLTNLKVLKGDAVEFLTDNITDNSLSKVQLFFPDPWHKKKHHKRRIVQHSFLSLLSTKLKNGAKFHLATDWQNYAEQMMETLEKNKNFKNTQPVHIYTPRPDFRPLSKFEKRGHRLGHGVWDLIFINEKT
ncbi:MAG: tRNA (guanosine(46)-N7)-methyltransferase TrmB [Gammaproteobacteria bacterium]|uniref:tRNA (guanine(46)-N(7))-methyltransferase n=1 Tax=hydrothermal vent metagenome TaxID=652676 RepID=A0A1W1E6J9_9ZZZZ|nr:tRNA (guanosine(46)-N7)-methyltransferase TrmB [Gammaproteobacteria bacterium]